MSLLMGIGRGLSQGAQIMSQGMAEDRQVKRAEEIERMREASIEKRWARDVEQRNKERGEDRALRAGERAEDLALRGKERGEDLKYRTGRDNQSDSQFNRQMTVREKQVIESNLTGIMQQEARSAEKIRANYNKRLESGMGNEADLIRQLNKEIKANSEYFNEQVFNMVQSYGDNLKGTGFEYLLSVQADEAEKAKDKITDVPGKQGQADLSGYVADIIGSSKKNAVPTSYQQGSVSPLATGFSSGMSGYYGDDAKKKADRSNFSHLDNALYGGARGVGLLFGERKDLAQMAGDAVSPAINYLTEKPQDRKKRLEQESRR